MKKVYNFEGSNLIIQLRCGEIIEISLSNISNADLPNSSSSDKGQSTVNKIEFLNNLCLCLSLNDIEPNICKHCFINISSSLNSTKICDW